MSARAGVGYVFDPRPICTCEALGPDSCGEHKRLSSDEPCGCGRSHTRGEHFYIPQPESEDT
jgi:hypothetical protein